MKLKEEEPIIVAMRGIEPQVLTPKRTEYGKAVRKQYENKELKMSRHTMQQLEPRKDGVTNTLTSVQKDNLVAEPLHIPEATAQGYADLETTKTKDFIEQMRGHQEMRYRIRKLTPRECFRLMGVDDKAIDTIQGAGISNTQMYKLAGNSIVVDTLYHLFRKMFCETENEQQQMTLF